MVVFDFCVFKLLRLKTCLLCLLAHVTHFWLIFTCKTVIYSYWYVDYASFVHLNKFQKMKALEPKIRFWIFFIYSLQFMTYFNTDKVGVIYMSIACHSYIKNLSKYKKKLFGPRAFMLWDFPKWIKTGLIYLSVAFHSHITCAKRPKMSELRKKLETSKKSM